MTAGQIDRRHAIGLGLGLAATTGLYRPAHAIGAEPIVETTAGRLQGFDAGGAHCFKGVFYAGAPARYQPAPPPVQWAGVRPALRWGAISPQGGPGTAEGEADEHCQVLNIWTPSLAPGNRPVLVWLHGGGFQYGSANSARYDGARLARERDVVVVSVNHRLGPFGFMYLADVDSRFEAAGAVGMLDIVGALRWTRDNIARFGGDPGRVMIFGQSGGGGKVLTLMTMPEATGLFQAAICESGSMRHTVATREEGLADRARILRALDLGAGDAARLITVPTPDLAAAQAKVNMSIPRHPVHPSLPLVDGLRPFSPVIDPRHIPEQPFATRAPQASRDVPLMIGSNTKELRRFSGTRPDLYALNWDQLPGLLAPSVGNHTADAISVYRHARPELTASDAYWAITADQLYWVNSLHVAERKAEARGAPVFMYRFAYDPGAPSGTKPSQFAGHGAELPFVFDNRDGAPAMPGEDKLSFQMSAAWASFAAGGRPRVPFVKAWPSYGPKARTTMVFDANPHLVDDPFKEERLWWQSLRA